MKRKRAYLVINPRSGKNVAKLSHILAVFSAADWKTDIALKEFGGHTLELAKEGAEAGYDLVIAYGGDGTLNQVVNGVMLSKTRRSVVGVLPGGTANVWAHEIGVPEDPIKAALCIVSSQERKVDIGHVEVESLSFQSGTKGRLRKVRPATGGRHHFLLMAGLGADAAVLSRISTPLKEELGAPAVVLTAAKELPSQPVFPIEVRSAGGGGMEGMLWKGEALQVILGNTRRYGNLVEMTPDAHIDDGVLDVRVITAGTPLTTMKQILSFLLHRKPNNEASEYFMGGQFWISVPASVAMQLDGSPIKLKAFLSASDRAVLEESGGPEAVTVTYRFDAMPRALRLAIPSAYDDTLFEEGPDATTGPPGHQEPADAADDVDSSSSTGETHQPPEAGSVLPKNGRKIAVVAGGPNPQRSGTYIVAGGASKESTGEIEPVAVRIDQKTILTGDTGVPLPPGYAARLSEGGEIVVEGKQSKRGVIRAKRIVVLS